MSYGHSLKTQGRLNESIDAYRRSIALEPRWAKPIGVSPI